MTERAASPDRKILIAILIAVIGGTLAGGFLPSFSRSLAVFGEIFLNLLMMVVVPLVFFSMVTGITNLGDLREFGSIGKRTILYYLVTTSIAVAIGLIMVNLVRPGVGIYHGERRDGAAYSMDVNDPTRVTLSAPLSGTRPSGLRLRLLDQGVAGEIEGVRGREVRVKKWDPAMTPAPTGKGYEVLIARRHDLPGERKGALETLKEVIVGDAQSGREGLIPRNIANAMVRMDILPVIFFSILLGLAFSSLGRKAERAVEIFSLCNDAILKIVDWIMRYAPVGIFALVAERIGRAGGFQGFLPELLAIGKYAGTVTGGLLLHGLLVLPLLLYFIGRRSPWRYLSGSGAPLLNALSTASSSATLPVTIETAERAHGLKNRIAGFVLPLGATINMDGTALYEAVAAIFIAQAYGIQLGVVEQSIVAVTATLAAIGAAGIPEAGLVTMVIVLRAAGLPVEGIGLLLSIDWLLDRLRTTVNVWGDLVGAGIIGTLEERDGATSGE